MPESKELNEEFLLQSKERSVESLARSMNYNGIPLSTGRIYGSLYFSNRPLTLDELKEDLQMSKTSMSTGVRYLLDMRAVKKVLKKGERKDLYQFKDDWYQSFADMFAERWKHVSDMNIEELNESKEELLTLREESPEEEIRKEADHLLKKVEYAIEYYDWLAEIAEVFESGQIFEMIPKPSLKKAP
ncbi:GbsR/MarR family transcriptional regulator [Bacillus sp. FJAT-44742]|uniref:GbsR/MarR family transcriptional regulator n=1 Tax=Bacillus sp. FJAT-44742 TaxID=2014005 RepID=UPI000C237BCE|nr:GbsR/MarR family transcriptional regulator [Bacillus sp. FJAT-44742]